MYRYLVLIVISVIIFTIIILNMVRKDRLNLKYALIWLFLSLIMIVAILVPGFLSTLAEFMGFQTTSNMLFLMAFLVLILISLSLTVIVSTQSRLITLLIQEVSMLKRRISELEKKK